MSAKPELGAARVQRLVPMLRVADVERSLRFYAHLGFETSDKLVHPGGVMLWAFARSRAAEVMFACAEEAVVPEEQGALLYLYSEDVAALRSHLLAAGLRDGGPYCGQKDAPASGIVFELTRPPYMPDGEIRVADPDGYCLLIGQLERE